MDELSDKYPESNPQSSMKHPTPLNDGPNMKANYDSSSKDQEEAKSKYVN